MCDDAPTVRAACGVRVGFCAVGDLHVEFLDEGRVVFARASMTREVFAKFIGECADAADAISLGGLAAMPIGGCA